ncbi:sugar phosphate isomerase/epimerase family protein [Erythrobacter sp. BLCC-B19]|uniref:sugar phosphate isomerase/epimerase family protein n=1 Tax=Erythrobacter sp. BLCC-B19 TaxID=3025315 RepID=UPI0023615CEC|nr:sugar phosphate isomerase/epimerase [Erythrobacter sp. BLCC-B19]WDA42562.1 sugar phosphate isomerase/epimerase [Erythrobacter sp. BLCC-B19]
MTRRLISLAAGIMPEATPAQLIECAAAADFDFGGMWVEKDSWTPATTRAIRSQARDAGVTLLDCEVAWIMPGPPDPWLTELVHIAAELGAANLLCVSSDPDMAATTAKFQALVDEAKGTGVRVNLEFGIFTEVKTIHMARAVLEAVEGEAKALLVDTLHWARSGGTAEDLAAIPRAWLSYCQPCDAPAEGPDVTDFDAIIDDAINRRLALGKGGLPLAAMVDALPVHLPMAVEERSAALRDAFPDLVERARECARTSRAWLEGRD